MSMQFPGDAMRFGHRHTKASPPVPPNPIIKKNENASKTAATPGDPANMYSNAKRSTPCRCRRFYIVKRVVNVSLHQTHPFRPSCQGQRFRPGLLYAFDLLLGPGKPWDRFPGCLFVCYFAKRFGRRAFVRRRGPDLQGERQRRGDKDAKTET